jgi:hypothetical protein
VELKLNGQHPLLVYADDVSPLANNIYSIKKTEQSGCTHNLHNTKPVFLATDPEDWVPFLMLLDVLRSSGSSRVQFRSFLEEKVVIPV